MLRTASTDRISPLDYLLSSFDIELISPIKRVLKAIPDPEETVVWNKTISATSANYWLFSIKRITKFRSLDAV